MATKRQTEAMATLAEDILAGVVEGTPEMVFDVASNNDFDRAERQGAFNRANTLVDNGLSEKLAAVAMCFMLAGITPQDDDYI